MIPTLPSNVAAPEGGFLANFFAGKEAPASQPVATESAAPEPTPEPTPTPEPEPAATTTAEPDKPADEIAEDLTGLDVFSDDKKPQAEKKDEIAEEEPPAGVRTKEAREAWKEGRLAIKERENLRRELESLKQTSGKIQDADPVKKENEALKARIQELEPVVARVAYQKSKAYEETIGKPMQQISLVAQSLAKQYEIADDKMITALEERDRKRQSELLDEVADGMTGLDKAELYSMATQLRRLFQADDEMANHASVAQREAEARESKEREQATIERKAQEMRAVTELKPKLASVARFLVKEGQTTEQYVESLIGQANSVPFDEHGPDDKAYLQVAGLILKDMAPAYKKALEQLKAKDAEIARMSSASPRTTNGSAANSSGAAKPSGFFEAFAGKPPPWAQR
jgi:hypothetical protein